MQDVDVLQEASGNDKVFEKKLLDAYQQTCVPHLAVLRADLSQASERHFASVSVSVDSCKSQWTGKAHPFRCMQSKAVRYRSEQREWQKQR